MNEGKVHRYESPDAMVTWDATRCVHAAECVRTLPQVFDSAARAVDPAAKGRPGLGRGRGQSLPLRRPADAVRGWDVRDGGAPRQ